MSWCSKRPSYRLCEKNKGATQSVGIKVDILLGDDKKMKSITVSISTKTVQYSVTNDSTSTKWFHNYRRSKVQRYTRIIQIDLQDFLMMMIFLLRITNKTYRSIFLTTNAHRRNHSANKPIISNKEYKYIIASFVSTHRTGDKRDTDVGNISSTMKLTP